jgi:hypothetical protein
VLEALRDLEVTILTTNYDSLIEEVTGRPAVTWRARARAQRIIRGDEPGVLHLHGHWQEPESVVLGIRTYEQLLGDEHAQALQQAMATTQTFLFIGFGAGLADPNFEAFRRWMSRLFKSGEYRHYRLVKADEEEILHAQHQPEERIFTLPYGESHADLAAFLRQLGAAPARIAPAAPGHVDATGVIVATDRRRGLYLKWLGFTENLATWAYEPNADPSGWMRQLHGIKVELDLLASPAVLDAVQDYINHLGEGEMALLEAQGHARDVNEQKWLGSAAFGQAMRPYRDRMVDAMRADVGEI